MNKQSCCTQYIAKSEFEKKLHEKIFKFSWIFKIIPFVKMIAVCNNTAFLNVHDESDIDIFIVAQKGRLFVVRTLVTFFLQIFAVRRYGKKVKERFCLSFFIDEGAQDLSKIAINNDVYLAYWINRLKPIVDVENFYQDEFLTNNEWILDYWESFDLVDRYRFLFYKEEKLWHRFFRAFLSVFFFAFWGNFIECSLKKWQLRRSNKKARLLGNNASVIVNEHILKFHNNDRRKLYRERWISKFNQASKLRDEYFLQILS